MDEVEEEARMTYCDLAATAKKGDVVVVYTEDGEADDGGAHPEHHGYHLVRVTCAAERAPKKLACPKYAHNNFKKGELYLQGTYMEIDHTHRRNSSDVHIYSTTADRKAVVYVSAESVRYVLPRPDLDWSMPLPGRTYRPDLADRGVGWQPVAVTHAVHKRILDALGIED
jgi:hypothetical protein